MIKKSWKQEQDFMLQTTKQIKSVFGLQDIQQRTKKEKQPIQAVFLLGVSTINIYIYFPSKHIYEFFSM